MAMQNPNQQFDPLLNQYYGFQLVLTKKSLFFKSIVYKIEISKILNNKYYIYSYKGIYKMIGWGW